jgi:hypothetical protein
MLSHQNIIHISKLNYRKKTKNYSKNLYGENVLYALSLHCNGFKQHILLIFTEHLHLLANKQNKI